MAAARLASELSPGHERPASPVLGDEPHPPYNRILLSPCSRARHAADALTLRSRRGTPPGSTCASEPACSRSTGRRREVGSPTAAGRLRPARPGLRQDPHPAADPRAGPRDGTLDPRVHAFRTLDDCRRLDRGGRPAGRGRRAQGSRRRRRAARPAGRAGTGGARAAHRGRRGRRPPPRAARSAPVRGPSSPGTCDGSGPRSTPAPAPSGSPATGCGSTTATSCPATSSSSPPAAGRRPRNGRWSGPRTCTASCTWRPPSSGRIESGAIRATGFLYVGDRRG